MNTSVFLRQTAAILLISLALGLVYNQLYPAGISWKLLLPSPGAGQVDFIAPDSAFRVFLDRGVQFVDIRSAEEYQIDHLPGAVSLPYPDLLKSPDRIEMLSLPREVVLYCFDNDCAPAREAADLIRALTGSQVSILYGGLAYWIESGYPVDQPGGGN